MKKNHITSHVSSQGMDFISIAITSVIIYIYFFSFCIVIFSSLCNSRKISSYIIVPFEPRTLVSSGGLTCARCDTVFWNILLLKSGKDICEKKDFQRIAVIVIVFFFSLRHLIKLLSYSIRYLLGFWSHWYLRAYVASHSWPSLCILAVSLNTRLSN